MDFVILGGGSLGSVCAGFFAHAGHKVRLVSRAGEHLDAIQANGLHIGGHADFTVRLDANTSASGECDVLVVATKTFDTATALKSVFGLRPRAAFSLQNGVLKDGQLSAAFGSAAVLGATTMMGATRGDAGAVNYTQDGLTAIGALDGTPNALVGDIAKAWQSSGLRITAVDNIASHEWTKQALQAGAAPLAAITQLPTHQIFGLEPLARLFVTSVREVDRVASAVGVRITSFDGYGFDVRGLVDDPFENAVARVVERGAALKAAGKTDVIISMARDVQAGRRTEIEETTGHIVREARQLELDVPLLRFLYDVVVGMEMSKGAR